MNYVTDRSCKQMLQNSTYITIKILPSQGGGVLTPAPPPRSAPIVLLWPEALCDKKACEARNSAWHLKQRDVWSREFCVTIWQRDIWSREFWVKMIKLHSWRSTPKRNSFCGRKLIVLENMHPYLIPHTDQRTVINNKESLLHVKGDRCLKTYRIGRVYKYRSCTVTAKTAESMHFFRIF